MSVSKIKTIILSAFIAGLLSGPALAAAEIKCKIKGVGVRNFKLDGFFNDGSLDNVLIVKNSTLLYYMYSDDGEFIGMNKTLASSILIDFLNNEISEVSFYRTPDGNVVSENKIILNEMKLPGFIWREEEKPNNINDLFSDEDKKLEIVEIE